MLIHEFQSDDGNKRLVLKFKKLGKNATAPSYGSSNAAGADLYSACDCTVPPKGTVCEDSSSLFDGTQDLCCLSAVSGLFLRI